MVKIRFKFWRHVKSKFLGCFLNCSLFCSYLYIHIELFQGLFFMEGSVVGIDICGTIVLSCHCHKAGDTFVDIMKITLCCMGNLRLK